MIRLAIICFLISMIESKDFNFGIDQLNKLALDFEDSKFRMDEATRGQSGNAAIVIGTGNVGKSTLMNYLMGNSLDAYRLHNYDSIKIKKANESIQGPEIGAGPLSTTTIPLKWKSTRPELQNLDLWDAAGFSDNRGVEQDLNNSFNLYHLTKKLDSLKFILIIGFDDIHNTNIQHILELLRTLEKYFYYNFEDMFQSISVIISIAPHQSDNGFPVNYDYLNYKLNSSLLSSPELDISEVSKDFVRYIINNRQQVAFFRKAEKLGKVHSDIDDNIIPAINNSKSISYSFHQNVGFPISEYSKNCLLHAIDDMLILDEFDTLQKQFENWFIEQFDALNKLEDTNTLRANKDNLEKIYNRIDILAWDNLDAKVKMQILSVNFDTAINFTEDELLKKINIAEFIDSLLTTDNMERIHIALDAIINSVYYRMAQLISLCELKVNQISLTDYKEKMSKDNAMIDKEKKDLQDRIQKLQKEPNQECLLDKFVRNVKETYTVIVDELG